MRDGPNAPKGLLAPHLFSHVFPHVRANVLVPTDTGPSYDPEASSYFTRAGITDTDAQTAINAFIVGVKADFTITLLDEVFDQLVLQANESAAAAVVDMTANEIDQLLANSPTVTQWREVVGTANGQYIDTNFNPTTSAVRFTTNSRAWGAFVRSAPAGQFWSGGLVGGDASTPFQVLPNNSGSYYALDGPTPIEAVNSGNTTGLITTSRTAAGAWAFYRNATQVGTAGTGPGTAPNANFFLLARNDNGGGVGGNATGVGIALSFFARGMTSDEMTAFSARVQTLKTAIGW